MSLSIELREAADSNSELIHWVHNDPENPFNFPTWRKAMICGLVCIQTSWAVMCSSMAAPIATTMMEEFGISSVQSRLPIAVFLFGMAIAPLVLTPLAEDYGRKKVLTSCLLILYIFHIPCALATNFETIVICRLICGVAGSPIINSVANIPDLWRGDDIAGLWAMNAWAYSAECIVVGPLIASYINAHFSWRWTYGIWAIVGVGLLVPYFILVPETRGGVILTIRAQKARKAGNTKAWALHEKLRHRSAKQILHETILRPAIMLFTEPIVYCFALYDGLNYGIIYLGIEAIPLIYAQYGLKDPDVELTFFALQLGFTLAIPLFYFQRRATLWRERKEGRKDVPEHKLLWAFFAAILFPISMFWFAWTGRPPINMYASLGALVAFAIVGHIIFLAVSDFTVESYGLMASSAVTGQSLARETICGVLSLVSVQFYENVGYRWASTILGILATIMGFFPFLFYKFGPRIRKSSRYARELATLEEEERQRLKFIEDQYFMKHAGREE